MLNIDRFIDTLTESGVEFYTGVPDSLLNGFCTRLCERFPADCHVMAANEGNAVATASGYYFASGTVPLVYMQNSGMGNALNPLLSLADTAVYSVPMLLLIGWRGEPDRTDWAQHDLQGKMTPVLLDDARIPYEILEDDDEEAAVKTRRMVSIAQERRKAAALIVKKGVLDGKKGKTIDDSYPLNREDAIRIVLDMIPDDSIVLATTGRATRELYFLREERGETHANDFLNVGSMGHVSSVAAGISLAKKERRIVCLDGDAATIMHLGALTTIAKIGTVNILHIILNNGANESVGGQPSAGRTISFSAIAEGCGYKTLGHAISSSEELKNGIKQALAEKNAPFLIDMKIRMGARGVLPPLKIDHRQYIDTFMKGVCNG